MSSEKEDQKKKATKAPGQAKTSPSTDPSPPPKPAAEEKKVIVPSPAQKPAPAKQASPPPPAVKQEPEPPAFEKGLAHQVIARFGESVKILYIKPNRVKIETTPSDIVQVATHLRDSMGFEHAESASGTEYPKDNQIEVNYHLGSYTRDDLFAQIMVLTTRANRDDPRLPSLIGVFPSVEYHERETFEMLGVYFEGHPRMERFLLPEDWADIPPLRKEFRIKGR